MPNVTQLRKAGADATRLSAAQNRAERAVKNSFSHIRDSLNLDEVRRQLNFFNYEGAIDAVVTPFHSIGDSMVQVYLNAAQEFTENIGQQIGQHVTFNPAQPRAVQDMRNLRAFFVQDLNATMRDAVRSVVMRGLQNNWDIERMLRGMVDAVGLTARDLVAIENYRQGIMRGDTRRLLETSVRDQRYDRSVLSGTAADRHLERMVAAKERLTRQISLTRLAQTEGLRAINMGRDALLTQLIDLGVVLSENVQRTWYAVGDPKTRDTHAAQSGETRGKDEEFSNGLMYPGDPNGAASEVVNCRCWLQFDVQPK
jgi:hypothetical protein